jgi:hypothetical protein
MQPVKKKVQSHAKWWRHSKKKGNTWSARYFPVGVRPLKPVEEKEGAILIKENRGYYTDVFYLGAYAPFSLSLSVVLGPVQAGM